MALDIVVVVVPPTLPTAATALFTLLLWLLRAIVLPLLRGGGDDLLTGDWTDDESILRFGSVRCVGLIAILLFVCDPRKQDKLFVF